MKVTVVGARGQLGAAIVDEFARGHDVTALGRSDLDITDAVAVDAVMTRRRPELIVNCAYYGNVDAAEDHPREALQANAFAVRAMARAAASLGATIAPRYSLCTRNGPCCTASSSA